MNDALVSLAVLILPTIAIVWAWRNRIRSAESWRERLNLVLLTILTADLALCAVALFWPYFGARQGSGNTRWPLTADLVALGFWMSAFALISAIVCKPKSDARTVVGQKFVLIILSLAATFFWFASSIAVNDFHAVEAAREAATQARPAK